MFKGLGRSTVFLLGRCGRLSSDALLQCDTSRWDEDWIGGTSWRLLCRGFIPSPIYLGVECVLRRLDVAAIIDRTIPPHPAHVLSCGRGVETLVLAILDRHHALYAVVL